MTAFTRAGGAAAIDGEILAWRDGRALPFSVLQQRIARKKMTEEVTAAVPVTSWRTTLCIGMDGC